MNFSFNIRTFLQEKSHNWTYLFVQDHVSAFLFRCTFCFERSHILAVFEDCIAFRWDGVKEGIMEFTL